MSLTIRGQSDGVYATLDTIKEDTLEIFTIFEKYLDSSSAIWYYN